MFQVKKKMNVSRLLDCGKWMTGSEKIHVGPGLLFPSDRYGNSENMKGKNWQLKDQNRKCNELEKLLR